MPVRKLSTKYRGLAIRIVIVAVILALAYLAGQSLAAAPPAQPRGGHAAAKIPEPVLRPVELAKAKRQCGETTPKVECRAALRRALAAIEWQRQARVTDANRGGYGPMHALRLASALYGVPLRELVTVARCESHLNPRAKNRHSTASGLLQFLDSTWRRAGLPGFSVFDEYANALAAARLVVKDGGWREWSCRP